MDDALAGADGVAGELDALVGLPGAARLGDGRGGHDAASLPGRAGSVAGRLDALDDPRGVAAAAGHVVLDGADLAAAVGDRLGRRRLSASIARDASARVLGTTKLTPRWRASWRR